MTDEGAVRLVGAIAENNAEEIRELASLYKKSSYLERLYIRTRIEELFKFYDSSLFTLAYPNVGEYIKDKLRKEIKL